MSELKKIDNKIEDKSICEKCGGKCCKKSGCGYIVSDFKSMKFDELKKKLDGGNISIKTVSIARGINKFNEATGMENVLVLKARSFDKDVVDLFSSSSKCKMLTNKGCSYDLEERPSLGGLLIPNKNFNCYPNFNSNEVVNDWRKYQDVLRRLVKNYTGKCAETVYSSQYVYTCATVIGKFLISNGDASKLSIQDREVLNHFNMFKNVMKKESELAVKLATDSVKRIIDRHGNEL